VQCTRAWRSGAPSIGATMLRGPLLGSGSGIHFFAFRFRMKFQTVQKGKASFWWNVSRRMNRPHPVKNVSELTADTELVDKLDSNSSALVPWLPRSVFWCLRLLYSVVYIQWCLLCLHAEAELNWSWSRTTYAVQCMQSDWATWQCCQLKMNVLKSLTLT